MVAQLSEKEQKRIDRKLWESARDGNIDQVKQLLQNGANFNCCNREFPFGPYTTPHTIAYINGHDIIVDALENAGAIPDYDIELWEFAREGNVVQVKRLLQNGANFNCRYQENMNGPYITPHTIAYIDGHNIIVDALENAGATPDYNEIMLAAARTGLTHVIKQTIQKKANVNYQDKVSHLTALHYASNEGHVEMVQLLLTAKADPNIFDEDHRTALHYASSAGHIEIVQLLLIANADLNVCDKWGRSPLHIAHWYMSLSQGSEYNDMVELLCSFGGNMDQVRNDDLLLTSAENGDIHNVNVALTSGANINVNRGVFQYHWTALHYASWKGHTETVQFLLTTKADPNISDKRGCTPAHLAIEMGHTDIVKLLLEEGQADISIKDEEGRTLAHLAAEKGHADIVKLLLDLGQADVNAKDSTSETLTSDSTQQGTFEPSEIFREYFADICDAIEVKPLPIVNRLYAARLISFDFKKDVQSMSGDNYDKADKVVNELQQQIQEKGIVFLNDICDFLLNQNHTLKDIGVKMKYQLEA